MPLIGADPFLRRVQETKQCWYKGSMGSGKTLCSVATADELVIRGVSAGVISNIPHALKMHDFRALVPHYRYPDQLIPTGIVGACMLFDEPWTKLDARDSMNRVDDRSAYGGFSRKLDCIYLLPSVHIIDSRLRGVQAQRSFRFRLPLVHYLVSALMALFGWLPWAWAKKVSVFISPLADEVWIYKWQQVEGEAVLDQGRFILSNPSHYYGLYDTKYLARDDAGIASAYRWTVAHIGDEEDDDAQWWVTEEEYPPRNSKTASAWR